MSSDSRCTAVGLAGVIAPPAVGNPTTVKQQGPMPSALQFFECMWERRAPCPRPLELSCTEETLWSFPCPSSAPTPTGLCCAEEPRAPEMRHFESALWSTFIETSHSKGFPQGFLLHFIPTAKGTAAPPRAFKEEFLYWNMLALAVTLSDW